MLKGRSSCKLLARIRADSYETILLIATGGETMTIYDVQNAAKLPIWQERVRECRTSGMSVKAWCKAQGLDFTTYYRWEKKVLESVIPTQREGKPDCEARALPMPVVQSQPSIVKVEISSSDVVRMDDPPQSAAGTVTFSINGTVISVAEDVSEQFLGKLVEAVKHGAC